MTIVVLDEINHYLLIKYDLIAKAILYFARPLTAGDKDAVANCLSLTKFGMSNTMINFRGEYYEYGESNKVLQLGDLNLSSPLML